MARLRQTTRKVEQVFKVAAPKIEERDWLPKFTANVNKQLSLISERFARIPNIEGFDPADYVQTADLRDELIRIDEEDEALLDTEGEEEGDIGGGQGRKHNRRTTRRRRQLWEIAGSALEAAEPTAAPPNVAAVSAIGTTTAASTGDVPRFALEDHTHGGVLGAPVGGGSAGQVAFFTSSFEIDGDAAFIWDSSLQQLKVGGGSEFLDPSITAGEITNNASSLTIGGTVWNARLSSHLTSQTVVAALWGAAYNGVGFGLGAALFLSRSRGTFDLKAIVSSGDELGRIDFLGYDGTDFERGAQIIAEVDAAPGDGDMPGRLRFLTTPDGSATPLERLRIENDGKFQIDVAAPTISALRNIVTILPNGITLNAIGTAALRGVFLDATITLAGNVTTIGQFFQATPTITTTGASRAAGAWVTYGANPQFGPAATHTITGTASRAVNHAPGFLDTGAAGCTATDATGLRNAGSVGANWTVTDWAAVTMLDPTGTGVITNLYGLNVAALTSHTSTVVAAVNSAITSGTGKFFTRDTGGAQNSWAGKFTTYNNVAVEGFGVPAIIDEVAITGRTTNIAATDFTNATVAGLYRVQWYLVVTTTAAVPTITVTITHTDNAAARTTTSAAVAFAATNFLTGVQFIRLNSGSIQYATTITGAIGTGVYAFYATCERLV